MTGTVAVAVAQWYLVWLLTREGGLSAVGMYSTLLAIAGPIFIGTQLGLRSVFVTLRQEYPWATYVVLRITGIAVGIVALLVVTLVVPNAKGASASLVGAIVAMKSFDSLLDLYYARMQKDRKFALLGTLGLANAGGTIVLSTVAVLCTGNVVAGVWASALVSAIVAITSVSLVVRRPVGVDCGVVQSETKVPGYRQLARVGAPLSIAQFLISLITYVPVVLVGMIGASADVGAYAAASYLFIFANLVGASVATIVLPSFAMTFNKLGADGLFQRTSRIAMRAALLGVLLIPMVVVLSPPVLALVYGSEYILPALEISLLATACAAAIPSYLFSSALLAMNNYRGVTGASVIATVVVLVASAVSIWGHFPAVTAGYVVLCIGNVSRTLGLYGFARLTARRDARISRSAAGFR
ncbi:hypothetical protein [Cryobacterium sp. Hb1]|uniref:hypothetical protein n=1 Tax=Cryobacterium sp. Hb1 TaxID=1259147 RepID=UPI00141AC5C9|nr:hypothetical protein [Cryobacterium sp. Hb1]